VPPVAPEPPPPVELVDEDDELELAVEKLLVEVVSVSSPQPLQPAATAPKRMTPVGTSNEARMRMRASRQRCQMTLERVAFTSRNGFLPWCLP
jgi:hypothetical protein